MLSVANESDFNVDYGLYVIKFWAPWCGPCKMYNPVIDRLDDEFESINFLSVDTDQVPELAKKFKITSLPTLVIIQDGEEKRRVLGLSMIKPLRTLLRETSDNYSAPGEDEEIIVPVPETQVSTG